MLISQKLNQGWRWFGTVFSFALFGVGGLLLPLIVFPCLYLIYPDTERRQSQAKKVIHHAFRFYIGTMRTLGVLDYETFHLNKFANAKLVLANHPSLIDVIFLIALLPNANCVVKGALTRNFFTRGPIKAAGYIINDESNDVIAEAKQAFARGDALIVFPEGTRTTPHQSIQFKRGAANIAIRAGADITPVLIECRPTTLTKSDRWYRVPDQKVRMCIDVRDLIPIEPYTQEPSPSLSARKLTRDLSTFFNKELAVHEHPPQ